MSRSWTREQITYCCCDALSYMHTHCLCLRCNGKAVSRSTEYRHWQEANVEISEAISLRPRTNSCRLNQGLDLQSDGEGISDTTMDTSTIDALEAMVTDHNMSDLDDTTHHESSNAANCSPPEHTR